jgi:hypothetical protein
LVFFVVCDAKVRQFFELASIFGEKFTIYFTPKS